MRISNVVEISLASLVHPNLEAQRKQEIQGLENKAKRAGALAIHRLVARFPEVATTLFEHNLHHYGYSFAGVGADYTAYHKDGMVTKVHRRSLGMTEPERQDLAEREHSEHRILLGSMPQFMIGQTVSVEAHPVIPKRRAVQIEQQFVDFEPTTVFSGVSDSINEQALESTCKRYPLLVSQWEDLSTSTLRAYEATGAVPDLTGMANIGIVSPEQLVLIDGQPIMANDPVTTGRILTQAGQVHEVLVA